MKPRDRFGKNLRSARRSMRISQERLGDLSNLDRSQISMLERGTREPRLGTILKLAGALATTPDVLCAGVTWDVKEQGFSFEK